MSAGGATLVVAGRCIVQQKVLLLVVTAVSEQYVLQRHQRAFEEVDGLAHAPFETRLDLCTLSFDAPPCVGGHCKGGLSNLVE